jgi:hypothetical protein
MIGCRPRYHLRQLVIGRRTSSSVALSARHDQHRAVAYVGRDSVYLKASPWFEASAETPLGYKNKGSQDMVPTYAPLTDLHMHARKKKTRRDVLFPHHWQLPDNLNTQHNSLRVRIKAWFSLLP